METGASVVPRAGAAFRYVQEPAPIPLRHMVVTTVLETAGRPEHARLLNAKVCALKVAPYSFKCLEPLSFNGVIEPLCIT